MTSTDDTRMKEVELREAEEGIEDGMKLPSMEIARTFAVESIDYPHPLGLQYIHLSPILSRNKLILFQPADEISKGAHA